MNKPLTYPLQQLISIKKNRFDQAVKVLEEKKALLDKAKAKLYDVTRERDEVLQHKTAKLTQLRAELDAGTTSDKIQQMKAYLKVVDAKLVEKQKKVDEADKQVDLAQKQVDVATQEMFKRKKDLEKLELHKKEWQREVHYWSERMEANEQDEQGSATYALRKKEEKLRQKQAENDDS